MENADSTDSAAIERAAKKMVLEDPEVLDFSEDPEVEMEECDISVEHIDYDGAYEEDWGE